MVRRLSYDEMVKVMDNIINPRGRGFSSEEINEQLIMFCLNCPDPAAAMDIVVEDMAPLTASEFVDKALACKPRSVADVPESELPLSHPLRHMTLDP